MTAVIATRLGGSGPKDHQAGADFGVTMLNLVTFGIAIVHKHLLDCEHTPIGSMANPDYAGCWSHLRAQT
ncbi:MAG: hypothetical protein ACXWOV_17050, partial [Isosphaeraceae bacterium]